MIGVSNHGTTRWVPAAASASNGEWGSGWARAEWRGRTFSVNVLADTAYSPILDRSVATVDVEQGALEEPDAATDEEEAGKPGAHALRRAARREAPATATGICDGPEPVDVFVEWAAVRHVGWWWNR